MGPTHGVKVWSDDRATKRVTAYVQLPAGLAASNVALEIIGSGDILELRSDWPLGVVEPRKLHRAFYLKDAVKATTTKTTYRR